MLSNIVVNLRYKTRFFLGILMGTGDVLSQVLIEKKSAEQYKWQHTARFFTLGAVMIVSKASY